MTRVKQKKRKQRLPDDEFIQEMRTKLAFFKEDKDLFIEFDKDFDDPFAANWKAEIDAAESEPTKKNLDNLGKQHTEALKEQMQLCKEKWSDAKHYIKKAFPKNPEMLDAFGNSSFRRSRWVPDLMLSFMNVLSNMCDSYRTELNAKGYSNDDIAQIDTLKESLENTALGQSIFIKAIPTATARRIEMYNNAYQTMAAVCNAGKIIFKNNYARRRLYLLHKRKKKKL